MLEAPSITSGASRGEIALFPLLGLAYQALQGAAVCSAQKQEAI